jgi:acetyl esterase
MAVDEATAALLEQMAASGAKPLHEMTAVKAREFASAMNAPGDPGPDMKDVRNTRVHTGGGTFPIRILTPCEDPRGVIVYYHGGGWVLGEIDSFDALGRHLAARTQCTVVLVDYRMAPEYRFPTAVEDSWAALLWTAGHLPEAEGDRNGNGRLIVAGDSAGGNLSAVMAQRAKKAGGPAIGLQVLIYPVTDCDINTTSYLDPANQLLLSRESMIWFWDHYAPVEAARTHPDASPLRSTALAGLPPAVVLTAEHDPLRDEGELYATQLIKAGVPVRHERFGGQMHGFFTMLDVLPGARAGLDFVVAAIDDHFAENLSLTIGLTPHRQHPSPAVGVLISTTRGRGAVRRSRRTRGRDR